MTETETGTTDRAARIIAILVGGAVTLALMHSLSVSERECHDSLNPKSFVGSKVMCDTGATMEPLPNGDVICHCKAEKK